MAPEPDPSAPGDPWVRDDGPEGFTPEGSARYVYRPGDPEERDRFFAQLGRTMAEGSQCELLWRYLVGTMIGAGETGMLTVSGMPWAALLQLGRAIARHNADAAWSDPVLRLVKEADTELRPLRNKIAHAVWVSEETRQRINFRPYTPIAEVTPMDRTELAAIETRLRHHGQWLTRVMGEHFTLGART